MLTFYNTSTSPNCLKTKIQLIELGVEYEQVEVELPIGEGTEVFALFPNAKLPAIRDDDGIVICESGAIALHLAHSYGGGAPEDPAGRALVLQAVLLEAALVAPTIGGQGIFGQLARPEEERDMKRLADLMPEAQRVAGVLGAVLGEREYFAGEYTVADSQLYAGVNKAIEYEVFKDPPKNLIAWDARVTARPAVQEARADYVGYGIPFPG